MSRVALALACLLAQACIFQNLSPTEKLKDAVIGYNDACRWNRLDLAVLMVDYPYRGDFRAMHYAWGRDIQIADLDILQVQTAGKEFETAAATVHYRWYDQRAMVIADTVVLQRYEKRKGNYVLVSEEVVSGDARLLEAPPSFEPNEEPGEVALSTRDAGL